MSYIYSLELKLARTAEQIRLNEFENTIRQATSDYNDAGKKSVNPKSIELIKIENSLILLHLTSASELRVVGKALRYFSQLLVKKIPILLENLTSSGQLFRVNQIGLPIAENEDPHVQLQAREVDDACLIKALIDYISKQRDPNTATYIKKLKAVEQMKQLAIEAGIITFEAK